VKNGCEYHIIRLQSIEFILGYFILPNINKSLLFFSDRIHNEYLLNVIIEILF